MLAPSGVFYSTFFSLETGSSGLIRTLALSGGVILIPIPIKILTITRLLC